MSSDERRRSRAELVAEDAEARVLAQTWFDSPFVLEAGAGTGKTTALVARIAAWALGAGWERAIEHLCRWGEASADQTDRVAARVLQRMVAITFTEAAAAEMATRVGEVFEKIAGGATPLDLERANGIDPRALPLDDTERRARAKALASALDRFGVRTIHAFARRLLATHPLEAGLHPEFAVDPDGLLASEVIREVLEARLREAYDDPGDPTLLALAACGVTAPQLEAELLTLVRSATPATLLEDDPFDATRIDVARREIVEDLERLLARVGSGLEGNPRTKAAGDLVARADQACRRLRESTAAGVAGIEALQKVLSQTLEPRFERLEDWAKGKFVGSERSAIGPTELAEIPALAARLHSRLSHLHTLDAAKLDLARCALRPLLAEATQAIRVRGIVSYDELLRGAERLLRENPEVAAEERSRLDQLLVDEFQDTDGLQCGIVEQLALRGRVDDRPGLFLVGDPKQSIYGWRGADLAAYDDFVGKVRAEGGRICRLYVNRRSVQPVLDEVARAIRPVMCAEPGVQPAFQPLLAHRGSQGFVRDRHAPVEYWVSRAWPPPEKRTKKAEATAIEALAVARDIAGLVREHGVAARDIGVLVRTFSQVDDYLTALREAGVPVAVARDRSYYRRREIIDAMCLVRCVIDPSDTLALVALLRSSMVGAPDAALPPLWRAQLPSLVARLSGDDARTLADTRHAVRTAAEALAPGVPEIETTSGWEHALLFALEVLGRLRGSFARDPSDVFVERLRRSFLFEASEAARALGAFRLANLERFFGEIRDALARGADPFDLLRHLRRSAAEERNAQDARPLDGADDAVQVMSIHGAKGLGFAHTYVVDLSREPRRRTRDALPPRVALVRGHAELRLFGERTLGFLEVEALEARTAAAEQVRTLYVAMTRAKDRLVLAGLWPESDSKSAAPTSHVALLADREAGVPPLTERFEACAASGEDRFDSNETRWVLPALQASVDPVGEASLGGTRIASDGERLARAEADAQRLVADRERARRRMARRFGGPVTQMAHEWSAEMLEAGRDGESSLRTAPGEGTSERTPVPMVGCGGLPPGATGPSEAVDRVASAAGTALHRALEVLDVTETPERAREQLHEVAAKALEAGGLTEAELGAARLRVIDLVDRFVSNGLFSRLRQLGSCVVARELAVLLAPAGDDTGPTGFVSGRIDLVYLDPDTGAPVVADYKTGRVESEAEVREAVVRHAAQGAQYVRAVRDALGLVQDPRFELWFVHAGRVETAA